MSITMDRKFAASCAGWAVPAQWAEVLFNYLVHGFPPGGFFTSWLANDMMDAMCHVHPGARVDDIKYTTKWIINEAPEQCHGSYEKVGAWLALSNDERRKICEDRKILNSMWDILKEKV